MCRAKLVTMYTSAKRSSPAGATSFDIDVGDHHIAYINRFESWMASKLHVSSTSIDDGASRRLTRMVNWNERRERRALNAAADVFTKISGKLIATHQKKEEAKARASICSSVGAAPRSSAATAAAARMASRSAAAAAPAAESSDDDSDSCNDSHNDIILRALPRHCDLPSSYFAASMFDSADARNIERARVNINEMIACIESRAVMCTNHLRKGRALDASIEKLKGEVDLVRMDTMDNFGDEPRVGTVSNAERYAQFNSVLDYCFDKQ